MLSRTEVDIMIRDLLERVPNPNVQDEMYEQLVEAGHRVRASSALRDQLQEQQVRPESAKEIVKSIIAEKGNGEVEGLCVSLASHGWLLRLDEVAGRFAWMRERLQFARHLQVHTSVPLEGMEREEIVKKMRAYWGMHIHLSEVVHPRWLGGVRLEADGWQFDATVRGALERLQKQLF
jgi:F0F1-type ATP synthase delta subunit